MFMLVDGEVLCKGQKLSVQRVLEAIEKHEQCLRTNKNLMCMCFHCRVARLLKGRN